MTHWKRRASAVGRWLGIIMLIALVTACSAPPEAGIVVGSGHIYGIMQALLDTDSNESMKLHTLIPPATCPGHFDMRPSDMASVVHSRAVLIHDWQTHLANVSNLLEAADIPSERIHVIDLPGSWMLPTVQAQAVLAVADTLAAVEPEQAEAYRMRAQERADVIQTFGEAVQAEFNKASPAGGVRVIANEMQAEFAEWLGLDVVGAFPRSENMSVSEMERFIRLCRDEDVVLVIENLQSGDPQNSKAIARDADAPHVILTNFPGGFGGDGSWEAAVESNIKLLRQALSEADG